ncbi:MAG: glycosyltransferase family 2 protein [Clostridium sp.]|nr:glycosyltransferase family 2 protein [Clostridium sp.]
MKKTISVLVPTYNEEENVEPLTEAVVTIFQRELKEYEYELVFIDNNSTDGTREKLRAICAGDECVKAIFNAKNFGQFNSPYYGLQQTTGDCAVLLCADFQDPIELIPEFVKEWEAGYKIVIGKKTTSRENKGMYLLRSIYYKMIKKMSEVEQIEHFTGFGLYDREFIEVLRNLHDPTPFLRGIVAELGWKRKEIPYEQQKRRAGKTKNNFYRLYDAAMLSFTSYTKIGLRLATFMGFLVAGISFLVAVFYIIIKLTNWDNYGMGMASIAVGLFFLGSVQLIFIGLIGEYILSMNQRIMNRPLVIEEERINFKIDPVKRNAVSGEMPGEGSREQEENAGRKETAKQGEGK